MSNQQLLEVPVVDTVEEDDTIFTNVATIAPFDIYNPCPRGTTKYLVCPECDNMYQLQLGCNARTCPACMQRRRSKLFNKYYPLIKETWVQPLNMAEKAPRIQFLTLTFINVMQISPGYLKARNAQLEAFRRRLERAGVHLNQGFICKEMTVTPDKGYHYHFHILFYADYIDLTKPESNLQQIWSDIVGYSAHVKLYSKFQDAEHALYYILKYSLKSRTPSEPMVPRMAFTSEGQPIQEPQLAIYLEMSKKAMNFRAFGKSFKPEPKLPLVCPSCMVPFKKDPCSYKARNPMYAFVPESHKCHESLSIDWKSIRRNIYKYDEITRRKPLTLDQVEHMLDTWMRSGHPRPEPILPAVHDGPSYRVQPRDPQQPDGGPVLYEYPQRGRGRPPQRSEGKTWQRNSRTQSLAARASAT